MKQIPLTQGKFALVDDEDFEWLSQWNWQCTKYGYAHRKTSVTINGKRKFGHIFMHREIIKTPLGMFTDHISGDRLDNQKKNLRICTKAQNRMNEGKRSGKSSVYKGVRWKTCHSLWEARIKKDLKTTFLGHFSSEIEAAKAYNVAAIEKFGEFARLNII